MARHAIGGGGPALLVDDDGASLGTGDNPLVVSGAPAGDATIADGGDVCEGAVADAAATAGGTGTISAKLRAVSASLGALTDAAETDPDAASASMAAILRGILTQQVAILAILTDVYDATGHTIKTSTP